MIYHNGWWHGSNAAFIRLLKENATIIVIGNKFTRAVYHAKILCDLFGDYYNGEEEDENFKPADSLLNLNPQKKIVQTPNSNKQNNQLGKLFKDKNKVATH
jgi:uroporphyrinogen-III synthase